MPDIHRLNILCATGFSLALLICYADSSTHAQTQDRRQANSPAVAQIQGTPQTETQAATRAESQADGQAQEQSKPESQADAQAQSKSQSQEELSSTVAGAKDNVPVFQNWEEAELKAEQSFIAGDLDSARKYWRDAIAIAEAKKEELNVATTLNQMNHLRLKTGEYDKAHQDLHKALAIRQKLLKPDDLRIAETMGNLALICEKLGRNQESEEWYEKTLALKKKSLSEYSPQIAITMHNLARLYTEEKRYDEAIALLQKVITIDQNSYGKAHVEVVRDLTTAGITCYECKEFKEAIDYFEQALALAQEANISTSDELLPIHHYLGICYAQTKQPDKAKEHYELAHKFGEKLQSQGFTGSTTCMLNLARNADDLGDQDCAEKLYQQACSVEDKRKPPNKLFLTQCLIEFGHYYRRHKQNTKALALYEHALVHYDSLPNFEKRKLYELPVALAEVLHDLGKNQASEEVSEKYLHVHTPHGEAHFRL